MNDDSRFSDIIGKTLESATLSADKERITFAFSDGTRKVYAVEGDCCSSSWIEHFETFVREWHDEDEGIRGAKLLSVEDSDEITIDDHPMHDCLRVYWTRFRTDRGDIVLEYRNSSNGYYGGYLYEVTP